MPTGSPERARERHRTHSEKPSRCLKDSPKVNLLYENGCSKTFNAVVVIPTYNERDNIERLVNGLLQAFDDKGLVGKVVIVDDNSPDGTAEAVRALKEYEKKVYLVVRSKKMGLGTAYAKGYRWALDNLSPDCIVQMDADLSHPPELVIGLSQAIQEGFDVAIGSRYVEGGGIRAWSFGRRLTSKGANFIIKALLKTGLQDNTSGYRAMKAGVTRTILEYDTRSKGYGYNVETVYLYRKHKLGILEIPFVYESREKGKTKLSMLEVLRFLGITVRLWIFGLRKVT